MKTAVLEQKQKQDISKSSEVEAKNPFLEEETEEYNPFDIQDIEVLRLRRDIAERLRLQDIKERLLREIQVKQIEFAKHATDELLIGASLKLFHFATLFRLSFPKTVSDRL